MECTIQPVLLSVMLISVVSLLPIGAMAGESLDDVVLRLTTDDSGVRWRAVQDLRSYGILEPSIKSRHAFTIGSRDSQSSETVDLEKLVPQRASVIRVTLRVDTPFTTISMKARTKACSLL